MFFEINKVKTCLGDLSFYWRLFFEQKYKHLYKHLNKKKSRENNQRGQKKVQKLNYNVKVEKIKSIFLLCFCILIIVSSFGTQAKARRQRGDE